jgi:hypothetical protein
VTKFKFIKQIEIHFCQIIDSQTLEILTNNCLYLEKLILRQIVFKDICSQHLISFGQTIGNKLKLLEFNGIVWKSNEKLLQIEAINQLMDCLLRFLPNLQTFNYYLGPNLFKWHNIMNLLSCSQYSLNNLIEINISYGINYKFFNLFTDKYYKQMKKIILSLNTKDLPKEDTNNSLIELSRFENLQILDLTLKHNKLNTVSTIDSGLLAISEKCLKLKSFKFIMFGQTLIKTNLFQLFSHFDYLNELKIKNLDLSQKVGKHSNPNTIECFKNMHNLTKLDLMLSFLSDKHLKHIDLYLPKLSSFKVSSDKTFTDKTLRYLSKMSHLSHIEINAFNCLLNRHITDSGVCHLIDNCVNIKTISLKCYTNITLQSIYAFIRRALSKPRIEFTFSYVSTNSCIKSELSCRSTQLPNNLILNDITNQFYAKYNFF